MDKEIIEKECYELANKYFSLKTDKETELLAQARNALFNKLQEQMRIWVVSILNKWGRTEDKSEVLYLSWEAFYFALSYLNLNNNIPLLSHFYKYTRYFLLNNYAKKEKVRIDLEELRATLKLVDTQENIMFEKMLTLYQFRDSIPEKYKLVWDDAFHSLHPKQNYKQVSKEKNMSNKELWNNNYSKDKWN